MITIILTSWVDNLKDFILFHSEARSYLCSRKYPVTTFTCIILPWTFSVVTGWEVWERTFVPMTLVSYYKVSSSKWRTFVWIMMNEKVFCVWNHFLSEVNGQQKGFLSILCCKSSFWIPIVMSESSNHSVIFSLQNSQSIRNRVTFLVKLFSGKIMFWSSEDKFEFEGMI